MPQPLGLGGHDLRSGRNSLDAIEPIASTENGDVVVDGNDDLEVRNGAIEIFRRIGALFLRTGFSVVARLHALRIRLPRSCLAR